MDNAMNIMLTLTLDQGLVSRAIERATELEQSFDQYVAKLIEESEPAEGQAIDVDDAVADALKRVPSRIAAGADFSVQDLFDKSEWARVESPRWLGRKFRAAVEKAKIAKFLNKTDQNKAVYRRIG